MDFLRLKPKILSVLEEGYTRSLFFQDLRAGILVAIVSIPMAIAFAIASGLRPEQGIYTAIVASFLAAMFSGSRLLISGPTGTLAILVLTILQQFGFNGFFVALIMAGILLILMGWAKIGAVIQFIPYPVTIGFTSALAILLATGQLRDFFGLSIKSFPVGFIARWQVYAEHLSSLNPYAFFISLISLGLIVYLPKITKVIPGFFAAIIGSTLLVYLFDLPVDTIGSRFGEVPQALSSPRLPDMSWELVQKMFPSAIAIALIAAIESLLSSVVAKGMTGRNHRPDAELVAQGIGNIAAALFRGVPLTGVLSRTLVNIKGGGQTPVAGMIQAVVLLFLFLVLGKWVALIPLSALAAILMFIAYNMSNWRHFLGLLRNPKTDIIVLLSTIFLTVFIDLATGIECSIILAAFLFINNLVRNSKVSSLKEIQEEDDPLAASLRDIPEEIEIYEIYGPFFFAATEKFKMALGKIVKAPKVLILLMRHVPTIDASGIRALEDILDKAKREGTELFLSGVQPHLMHILRKSGFLARLGEKNAFRNVDAALQAARPFVSETVPVKEILQDRSLTEKGRS